MVIPSTGARAADAAVIPVDNATVVVFVGLTIRMTSDGVKLRTVKKPLLSLWKNLWTRCGKIGC